jgi:CelD/BcsL family acetyltransferase involved in cellulose biosynthesis
MILGSHPLAPALPVEHDAAVDVIADARAFELLRDEWNALLDASGSWNPFLTWEWMWAWWAHLRDAATLNIVTVRSGGRLIAIAPLMIVRRGLSVPPRLEFIGVGSGADYLDVIVRTGDEAVALAALARAVDAQQLALQFDNLPPSPMSARLWRELAGNGWTAIEGNPDVCPFIDLSGHSWDSYLASLGSSHRANVRRRLRALAAAFDMRFAVVESHEVRRVALEELFKFHDQRWTCGGSTAFSTTPLRAFHQDLTRSALDRGWLRMYTLSLDNTLVGAMYGFARDGRFYFYQHGTDAAYARYSLGLVLMGLTVRAAIDDGVREFDMLYGHEAYKKLWAAHQRPLGRLMLFPPRLAGRWLQRRAETRQAVRAFVRRLGLYPTAQKPRGGGPGLKGSHDLA